MGEVLVFMSFVARSLSQKRALSAVVALGVLSALVACSDPQPGSPEEAQARTVSALETRDAEALFALLDAEIQGELDALLTTLRQTVTLVDTYVPKKRRAAARAAAGAGLIEGVEGPGGLFARMLAPVSGGELSAWQRLGVAPGRAVVEGDTARVVSRGGGAWVFHRAADESWRWVPPEADRRVIRDALAKAKANLARIQHDVARIKSLKTRGEVHALTADEGRPSPAPSADVVDAPQDVGSAPADAGAAPNDTDPRDAGAAGE